MKFWDVYDALNFLIRTREGGPGCPLANLPLKLPPKMDKSKEHWICEDVDSYERSIGGVEDVLLWNERGELTESCIANLVVEKEGRFLTPPLRSGLLPGTYRAWMLERGELEEEVLPVESLDEDVTLYLMNSVRGLWKVSLVGRRQGSGERG